ncbi:MAG: hypothetical protein ACYDAQ_06885, partial [Mycobacteriales bacterium]
RPPAPPASAGTAAPPPRHRSPADHPAPSWPAGLGLAGAAVGLAALLDRQRRRAGWRRRAHRRIPLATGALAAAEAALRSPEIRDAAALVAGAAQLAAALAEAAGGLPALLVARGTPAGVELGFAGPAPPPLAPFTAGAHGGWYLAGELSATTFAVADNPDPAPALVALGTDGDATVHLNLEVLGAIALDLPAECADLVAASLASQLAGAPWTGLVDLIAATALPTALPPTDRWRTAASLGAVLDQLGELSAHTAGQLRVRGAASLAAARMSPAEPPDGVSVVLAAPDDPGLARLLELAADPATPVVALVTAPFPGVAALRLDGAGLHVPQLDGPLAPLGVTAEALAAVCALLEGADGPDVDPASPPYDAVAADTPAEAAAGDAEVLLLGPVEVTGAREPVGGKSLDLLAYLACHRGGADAEKIATALWQDDARTPKTLRNLLYTTRRALGGCISFAVGKWRLDATVTSDWQRFKALAAGTLAEQRAALELVRGQPLEGIRADWADVEGHVAEMVAAIVDLATDVGTELLAAGEPLAAAAAALAALRACPYDDRLHQIEAQAAALKGAVGELRHLQAKHAASLDLDLGVDSPDELTRANQRMYANLSAEARRNAALDPIEPAPEPIS